MVVGTTERPPLGAATVIRLLRERADLSARSLSLRAGLSESYVGKIESGECSPSLRAFAALASVLGMTSLELGVVIANEAATRLLRESVTPSVQDEVL